MAPLLATGDLDMISRLWFEARVFMAFVRAVMNLHTTSVFIVDVQNRKVRFISREEADAHRTNTP
jgi:hypothetical protein